VFCFYVFISFVGWYWSYPFGFCFGGSCLAFFVFLILSGDLLVYGVLLLNLLVVLLIIVL
jgi:hypothetical protein